jgi:predicted MFS family arabinose efflux permease
VRRIRGFSLNARMWFWHAVINAMAFSVSSVLFTLFLVRLGHKEQFIGSYSSVSAIAAGIMVFPMGLMMSNRAKKGPMLFVVLSSAVLCVLQVLFPEPEMLLATAALLSALDCIITVSEGPFMMDNSTPEDRTYLFSAVAAGMSAVGIMGAAVAGELPGFISRMLGHHPESILGYRYAMLVGIFFRFVSAIPLFYIRETQFSRKEPVNWRMVFSMPSRRVLPRIFLVRCMYAFGAALLFPFVSVLMKVKLGASTETIGLVASVSAIANTVAYLAGPTIERTLGITGGIAASLLLTAPFLLTMGFSTALGVVAISVVLKDAILMSAGPLRQRLSMELVTKEERPVTIGLEQIFWQLPWAAGAWLGGRLIVSHGYELITTIAAALFVLAGLSYRTLFRRELQELARGNGPGGGGP